VSLARAFYFAKAWALRSGIHLACDLGVKDIVFETDVLGLFHMIMKGHATYTPLILMLDEIHTILHSRDWTCSICFAPREANQCAHMFVQYGHSTLFHIIVVDYDLAYLQPIVRCDADGVYQHTLS
jgi:hypothetical protein